MVAEGNGAIRLFETDTWEVRSRYLMRSHRINDSVASDDDTLIVPSGENGRITGWPGQPPIGGVLRSRSSVSTSTPLDFQ